MNSINIRKAEAEDCEVMMTFIKELALFEKAPNEVTLTAQQLQKDGFSNKPAFEAYLAFIEEAPAGMALFYHRYSTWKGRTLYLEDLYVATAHRGKGVAKSLMKKLSQTAIEENCERLEWQVLEWNRNAISLYESIGASLDSEWINGRLTPETMTKLLES